MYLELMVSIDSRGNSAEMRSARGDIQNLFPQNVLPQKFQEYVWVLDANPD